jgi:hypothetical protein
MKKATQKVAFYIAGGSTKQGTIGHQGKPRGDSLDIIPRFALPLRKKRCLSEAVKMYP